jgi:hypothetical protein
MFKLDHKLCFYNELLSFDLDHCSIEWKGEPHGFYNLKSVFLRHPIPIDPVAYRAFYWFVRESKFGEFLNFTYTDYNKGTLLNFTGDSSMRNAFAKKVIQWASTQKDTGIQITTLCHLTQPTAKALLKNVSLLDKTLVAKIDFTHAAWEELVKDHTIASELRFKQEQLDSLTMPLIAATFHRSENGYQLDMSEPPSDIKFHIHEIKYAAESFTSHHFLRFKTYKYVYQSSLLHNEDNQVQISLINEKKLATLENLEKVEYNIISTKRHVFEEYFYHLAYECFRQGIADIAVEKDRMIFTFTTHREPSPVQHDYAWPEVQQQQDYAWPDLDLDDLFQQT